MRGPRILYSPAQARTDDYSPSDWNREHSPPEGGGLVVECVHLEQERVVPPNNLEDCVLGSSPRVEFGGGDAGAENAPSGAKNVDVDTAVSLRVRGFLEPALQGGVVPK